MASRTLIFAAALFTCAGTALIAATPAQNITERQEGFKAVGRANKAIRDELAKPAPDFAVIRNNAAALHRTSRRIGQLFGRGTGPETGIKTGSLPIIWTQWSDFRSKHIAWVNAARGLETAARSNNADTVKAALQTMGGTCKGCHDTYRLKD